jgi:hypothetical protein
MGKVKQWSVEKKDAIETILINMWLSLNMEIPSNYEDIVQFCYEDVCETADPENWNNDDVVIAFRRWIENNSTPEPDKQPLIDACIEQIKKDINDGDLTALDELLSKMPWENLKFYLLKRS